MKTKRIVLSALLADFLSSSALLSANIEVQAATLTHSKDHYTTSSYGEQWSGDIVFDGDILTSIYCDGNWLGTCAKAYKTTQSGTHSCGVSGGGKSKWTNDTTATNISSGRISNGSVRIMGIHQA